MPPTEILPTTETLHCHIKLLDRKSVDLPHLSLPRCDNPGHEGTEVCQHRHDMGKERECGLFPSVMKFDCK